MSPLWTCPLCGEPLRPEGKALQCPARHSFDYARERYVNLLATHRRHSREPGDSREMIDARRRVHGADVYRPLLEALVATLQPVLGVGDSLLDLGCGEGYYSHGVTTALPRVRLYGVDIAKPAVRLAAKACPQGEFAVASAFDLPLPEASMQAIFSVFAPASDAELLRLLKQGGYYLKVMPGADHLWELRQLLYDAPRRHDRAQVDLAGFESVAHRPVQFALNLQGALLHDLVAMTPYAYGGQRENKARLLELESLQVQADFVLSLYRRGD
ncbi:putative RNA methyltransferase [Pseudohalioglobus lutimaris]|uniref:Methyltransferase domain-containing protein n=1 Tax=Pseudohalioglobus lutimaris TaxID=1737061 RepID=A0A2N5X5F0_9GAMM|nr:methyltransferase domain-containing protein [Pseudohalioglobus lutimaris]PLW69716.1 methyltransferase domain-containing protein [Pseudohalioglobus lutimaris]